MGGQDPHRRYLSQQSTYLRREGASNKRADTCQTTGINRGLKIKTPRDDQRVFLKTRYKTGLSMRMRACVGHSPQTRLFSPAENFARVRLRNFCLCKRPSFLASRRFASGKPDTSSHDLLGQKHTKKRGLEPPTVVK